MISQALETDICAPLLADPTKKTDAERRTVILPIIEAANSPEYNLFLMPTDIELLVSLGDDFNATETGIISHPL